MEGYVIPSKSPSSTRVVMRNPVPALVRAGVNTVRRAVAPMPVCRIIKKDSFR